MESVEHRIADLILELEREMRALGLWESLAPPSAALRSVQPFSVDTLDFTQWLQWVFIPRIADLIAVGDSLPRNCEIAPLAEMVFDNIDADTRRLLGLIRNIDRTLTD